METEQSVVVSKIRVLRILFEEHEVPNVKKRIISKFQSLPRRRQRGAIMVLTAVTISAMIGMLALAMDVGFLFSLRTQYQNGIDAAALAAASALRVTIEESPSAPQQDVLARQMAKETANANEVRRYADPPQEKDAPPKPNANAIVIDDGAVSVDKSTDLPKAIVDSTIQVPTLFAGIVGFYDMTVRARAVASLFPVDGGTGTMAAGTSIAGGCWRPIFLPDTFYDSAGVPHILLEQIDDLPARRPMAGDYYRSRFAAGVRDGFPFVHALGTGGPFVTGLRDTQLAADIGTKTIMGKPVSFNWRSYFVADLSSLPRTTYDQLTLSEFARLGYCGQLRVGDEIPVYPRENPARVEDVRRGLVALMSQTIDYDQPDVTVEGLYHYVTSNVYPGPNMHPAIIPVLFYDPFLYDKSPTTLKVTNIGLFLLKKLDPEGNLHGYFVREIIVGGTPIASANFENDRDLPAEFKRSWLPMSVQLLK